MEQNKRRDALNLVFLGRRLTPVHVDFDDLEFVAHTVGELFERGGLLFAGAAPVGVEIDQNGRVAFDKFAE